MHTYSEGCVAIVARDYAWFLSDAQIPVLEGVSEEDDSEEDLYWSTIELLRDPIAQTVNANRYATPSSSRCWGEAAQLDGKNYPVEKTEAGEWHSTKGCHQCIRQVILVIGLNSVPARLAKFSGHVGILPMPIHAAASKQDKRASCSKSNCKPRRCFTTAAACTCASTPQSYTRLLKTSTSKAFASSASSDSRPVPFVSLDMYKCVQVQMMRDGAVVMFAVIVLAVGLDVRFVLRVAVLGEK